MSKSEYQELIAEYKEQIRILKQEVAELQDAGKSKDSANKRTLQKLENVTDDLEKAQQELKELRKKNEKDNTKDKRPWDRIVSIFKLIYGFKIGEDQAVQMPMKTVISLINRCFGTMGYFQIVERLNVADTKIQIMEKDLEENTLFRIKWPRGEMGSLPADSEQFMMLEDLYKQVDKINKQLDSMMNNRINIEFLRGQMDKVLEDIEELKDKNREMHYQNGRKDGS